MGCVVHWGWYCDLFVDEFFAKRRSSWLLTKFDRRIFSDETGVRNGKKRKLEHAPLFEKACFNDIREFLEGVKLAEKEAKKNMTKEDREIDRIRRLQVTTPACQCVCMCLIQSVCMSLLTDRRTVYVRNARLHTREGCFIQSRSAGTVPRTRRTSENGQVETTNISRWSLSQSFRRCSCPSWVFHRCVISTVWSHSHHILRPLGLPPWLRGHSWQDVFHDNRVTWLAFYKDTVNNSFKYEFLAASSAVKGMKDFLKYELARKLKVTIGAIRSDYKSKMECKSPSSFKMCVCVCVGVLSDRGYLQHPTYLNSNLVLRLTL